MGGHEVSATAADIAGGAEEFHAHGGAFDMPTGAAISPGGFPGGFTSFGRFPEGEIGGVPFATSFERAVAGFLIFQATVGKLAVIAVFSDIKPDVAIYGIGETSLNQLLADVDNFLHVLGGFGEMI